MAHPPMYFSQACGKINDYENEKKEEELLCLLLIIGNCTARS